MANMYSDIGAPLIQLQSYALRKVHEATPQLWGRVHLYKQPHPHGSTKHWWNHHCTRPANVQNAIIRCMNTA